MLPLELLSDLDVIRSAIFHLAREYGNKVDEAYSEDERSKPAQLRREAKFREAKQFREQILELQALIKKLEGEM